MEHLWKALSFEDKEASQTDEGGQVIEGKNKDKKKNHKCPTCAKLFPSGAHLKEHEISHSDEQQYHCTVCDQGFKRKNALSKHMRVFHPDGPDNVLCSCGKVFASRKLMEKHKESSGQHRLLVCGECGVLYKTQASLDSHLMLHRENQATSEGAAWPYTCHTCQEKFSSRASLSNHTKDVHTTSVFQCPECSKICKTQKQLHLHRLRRHTAGDREFLCPLCSKSFHVLKDLRRHMQTHNPTGTRECPVCHTKLKTDSTLRSHMKSHSKGKLYDCSICLFPCCSLEVLKDHLLRYHSIDDVGSDFSETWNSKCLVCRQVFLRRSVLAQHMKTHFGPEDTQLVLLEDTDIDIARNTPVRQELNEVASTTSAEIKDKVSVSHEKPTQAELNSVKTQSKSFHIAEERVADSKQETVIVAQTATAKGKILEANSDSRIILRDQGDQGRLSLHPGTESVWAERSIQILEDSAQMVGSGPSTSSRGGGEPEETRYICEACSLVLTDMEELKVHLLTCYKEDSSDECFVVFEVDENNKI